MVITIQIYAEKILLLWKKKLRWQSWAMAVY